MKQTSKRMTSMLLALLFVVMAVVVLLEFVQPSYAEIQQLKGVQAGTQELYDNMVQTVAQVQDLISKYNGQPAVEESLSIAMPSGPAVAGALAQVYGIATNNNLAIQSINISPPTTQLASASSAGSIVKPRGTYSLQIAASGSYESLKSFLAQIETNLRIFDVTAVNIQPAGLTGTRGNVGTANFFTYNITVATYYQLQ